MLTGKTKSIALYYVILSFLIHSCIPQKATTPSRNINLKAQKKPSIIFLNYNILKTNNEQLKVELINKTVVNGNVKSATVLNAVQSSKGELSCTQLDKKSLPIKTVLLKNPLVKNIEYIDKFGELNKKTIQLDSIQFSIRMQLNDKTKYIILKKTDNTNKVLNKLKL